MIIIIGFGGKGSNFRIERFERKTSFVVDNKIGMVIIEGIRIGS